MLAILFMLAASTSSDDPLLKALKSFNGLKTYKVTLRSGESTSPETIRYYYKKPGKVRMEFIEPHKGVVLVYDPVKKEARIWPFQSIKSFSVGLSPENRLIMSPTGHTVDKSDIGDLLKTAKKLQAEGIVRIIGEEVIGGRKSTLIEVRGNRDVSVEGVHIFHIWMDGKMFLPIKAASFDLKGSLIEEVLMDDLTVDVEIDDSLFNLEQQ